MRFADAATAAELAECLALRRNDLTSPAIALVPEIEMVLGAIRSSTGCLLARMSGSGATCFGLFGDAEAAEAGAAAIREEHPRWWVAAGRLLDDTAGLAPA